MYLYDYLKQLGIERFGVVLGLSSLSELSRKNLLDRPQVKVALPDNLIRLIELASEGSTEHMRFLHTIVSEFGQGDLSVSPEELTKTLNESRLFLSEAGSLIVISEAGSLIVISEDDIDNEVRVQLAESFGDERYFISLSPLSNFVKSYYLRVVSWARKTGGLIVEKTSYFYHEVGHFITTLQIPDRFDKFVNVKKNHIDRIFSFKHGAVVKWFIGAVSSTAGIIHPLWGVPGLLIAYMDP